jgi:hypothetical protein
MSLLKLWFIRNPVLVSYSICVRQGSSNLSGSQSDLTCLCVCARAQLGLREFNIALYGGWIPKLTKDKVPDIYPFVIDAADSDIVPGAIYP